MKKYGRLVGVMAGLGVLASGLVGCSSTESTEELDAAIAENNELRDRLSSIQGSLDSCNTERARLMSENSNLLSQMDTMSAPPPQQAGTPFDSMAGVSVDQRTGGEIAVGIAGDVLFSSGQATLRKDAMATLDGVASVLNSTYAGNQIRVEGYTDSDPIRKSKWASNEQLSSERALAVEKYLVSKGVDNNRVYAAAFGPSFPKGTKKDSRRVEIVILGQG